jgi:hypothetical protein
LLRDCITRLSRNKTSITYRDFVSPASASAFCFCLEW